jgi:transcriptional regulator GlxA family with amidase domain
LTRDAIKFLEASRTWRVPILRLCREVGVSERRLLTAFQEQYGLGPQEFMHHRALQGAHQALLDADPAVTTVASIAAEHGFAHGGRFAQRYRSTFGEPPSATLARHQR